MDKLKFAGVLFLVFLSGVNVANNVGRLVEINPNYNAAWWKVGFALVLAVTFGVWAWRVARYEP